MEPEILQQYIRQTLPEARLVKTSLPLMPGLVLFLLSPVNLQRTFSAEETRKIFENTPYWSFCWASGQALGFHISRNKGLVRGKRVLDFGSGSGAVAIAAARAGAEEVLAGDSDEHALEAVRANAILNRVNIRTIRTLDELDGKVDLILVADLLYDPDNYSLLDIFFEHADEALLADSRVKDFSHPRFYQLGCITARTIPDLNEGQEYNRVRIYRGSSVVSVVR